MISKLKNDDLRKSLLKTKITKVCHRYRSNILYITENDQKISFRGVYSITWQPKYLLLSFVFPNTRTNLSRDPSNQPHDGIHNLWSVIKLTSTAHSVNWASFQGKSFTEIYCAVKD